MIAEKQQLIEDDINKLSMMLESAANNAEEI
jgi:hypothetical protein